MWVLTMTEDDLVNLDRFPKIRAEQDVRNRVGSWRVVACESDDSDPVILADDMTEWVATALLFDLMDALRQGRRVVDINDLLGEIEEDQSYANN